MSHLRVVSDTGDIVTIGPVDIFEEYHRLADEIGDAETVVTIALGPSGSVINVVGEQLSHYTLMGIFEAAKFEMMADLVGED